MTEKGEHPPAGWHPPEDPIDDPPLTFLAVPYVSESMTWKSVSLEVLFDVSGKPSLIDVGTENLIEVERKELLAWLRR